jgi:hypothetical protein
VHLGGLPTVEFEVQHVLAVVTYSGLAGMSTAAVGHFQNYLSDLYSEPFP